MLGNHSNPLLLLLPWNFWCLFPKCPMLSAILHFAIFCMEELESHFFKVKISSMFYVVNEKLHPSFQIWRKRRYVWLWWPPLFTYFIFGVPLVWSINGQSLKRKLCWLLSRGNDLYNSKERTTSSSLSLSEGCLFHLKKKKTKMAIMLFFM